MKAEPLPDVPAKLPTDPPGKLLVTAKEACHLLSLGRNTVWSLTVSGQLPAIKIGRAVRYDVRDLAGWIERMKKKGGNDE